MLYSEIQAERLRAVKVIATIGVVFLLAVAGAADATPGAVNAQGCHNSKKIGYHCHPERAKSGALPGDGTREARDRRLKRECKGRPNAGACLGYAS
jgi:hypothetical protein